MERPALDFDVAVFKEVAAKIYVPLLPRYIGRIGAGVDEFLNAHLMRYSEDLGGIVLAYHDVHLLQKCGTIIAEYPHIHFHVGVKMTIFTPVVGKRLVGTVNKIGVDYIGMLVFGVFNASVPKEAMRNDIVFDDGLGCWYDNASPGNGVINVGAEVAFTVTRLETVNDVLAISGSLLGENTGLRQSGPGDVNSASPATEVVPDSAKRKKRKDRDGDEEAAAAEASEGHVTKRPKKEKKEKREKEVASQRADVATVDDADGYESVAAAPLANGAKEKKSKGKGKRAREDDDGAGDVVAVAAPLPAKAGAPIDEPKKKKSKADAGELVVAVATPKGAENGAADARKGGKKDADSAPSKDGSKKSKAVAAVETVAAAPGKTKTKNKVA